MQALYDKVEIFKRNLSTLKETSFDKDGIVKEYMTESQIQVADFDGVKNDYIRNMKLSGTPCSNDALYMDQTGKYVFIEFKNGSMSKRQVYNVYNKIYDSLLMLNDIIGKSISFSRENVDFILVYNEAKNSNKEEDKDKRNEQELSSKVAIGKYFSQKAKKKFIRFDMEKFQRIYFREVFTYTENEFEEEFVSKIENGI